MASIPCDIVLLPTADLATKAIAVSEQLQQYHPHYLLSSSSPFPHLSLYMMQLNDDDTDNMDEIARRLSGIANTVPALSLVGTNYGGVNNYIDIRYQRFAELDALQMSVVNAINPLRYDMRDKEKVIMLTATGLVLSNLETYGYPHVGELFGPHISLTKFVDDTPIDMSALPDPSTLSGVFNELGLFEMGESGTCVRKIAGFPLAG